MHSSGWEVELIWRSNCSLHYGEMSDICTKTVTNYRKHFSTQKFQFFHFLSLILQSLSFKMDIDVLNLFVWVFLHTNFQSNVQSRSMRVLHHGWSSTWKFMLKVFKNSDWMSLNLHICDFMTDQNWFKVDEFSRIQ